MLPIKLKPLKYHDWNQEKWEKYVDRVGVPNDEALRQFYRQVVFDHFEHHNYYYPEFLIEDYDFKIIEMSVSDLRDSVKFFSGESVADMWGFQYDEFEEGNDDYVIFQYMCREKTPPFPPIIIESSKLVDSSRRVYGRPIHLVEGTHRSSYLLRMAERKIISWESKHKFVLLSPKVV